MRHAGTVRAPMSWWPNGWPWWVLRCWWWLTRSATEHPPSAHTRVSLPEQSLFLLFGTPGAAGARLRYLACTSWTPACDARVCCG